jgi:hypothetical protein
MAQSLTASQVGMITPENGYLSGEDKLDWATAATAFVVHEIELDLTSSYAEKRWVLHVETTDGERRRLGLNCNPRRDAAFVAMQANLASGGSIGPLALTRRMIGDGKSVWELIDVDPVAEAAAAVDQSDVPF